MTNLAVQRKLMELGYYDGPLDGRSGAGTRRAAKAFQIANGLAADGIVGPITLAALGLEPLPIRPDEGPWPQEPAGSPGPWPRQRDCMSFYGGVGLHQVRLELPYPMRLAWDRSVRIGSISVHAKVHDSAGRALARIAETYDEKARARLGIDLFGGSLNVRRMRGGSGYSVHAWGAAIDFDPGRNALAWGRDRARLAQPDAEPFWRAFEDEGWVSLGRARNFDWMHVQAARP